MKSVVLTEEEITAIKKSRPKICILSIATLGGLIFSLVLAYQNIDFISV
jgi:hypothetical protein